MNKEYKNLIEGDFLNCNYKKSCEEDFIGDATKNLVENCQFLLYYYPLKNNLITEQTLSDFYLTTYLKIRNTIYNFDSACSKDFKSYFLNFIRISIKYFKLKIRHDYLYDNLMLEVVVKHSEVFEKEVIYEDKSQNPITIANLKYKIAQEEQQYYCNNIDCRNLSTDKTFLQLFNETLININLKVNDPNFKHLDCLRAKIERKSTKRSILLLLLTMPDAILENFINEVAYIYSADKLSIINLFSVCRELQKEKIERYEKYSQLNNKHYKNYLINYYKLKSNLFNKDQLNTSISWDKKAMINNAKKIRKTLNMHVSQRTLAKALDIKKGTVASSISAAKSLLNQSLKLS